MALEQLRLPEPEPPDATSGNGPLLLTIREAAALLSVCRTTVYELVAAGELETVHIGRSVRFPTDAAASVVTRLRRSHHADG